MADGAAKMSSSKVIKTGNEQQQVSDFSFTAVFKTGSVPTPRVEGTINGFTPMALFDPSELKDKSSFAPRPEETEEPPPPPPPPGRFITDEDLERYQEESYQRGLQDGKNLAERGLLNVFKSLRTAAEDVVQLRDKVLRDAEDDLLLLTMTICRKVIAREVAQDRRTVVRLIRAALNNLHEQDDLIIRVHPDDHALLTTSQNQAVQAELTGISFSLKPDPTVEIGSCLIETERGTVDAGFEAQLDEVYRRLLEVRAEEPEELTES